MAEAFEKIAESLALSVEAAGALLIGIGAAQAFYRVARLLLSKTASQSFQKRLIWLEFAAWLLLGLEFELAADVIRSSISPTWSKLGQLAAVALIRTFLSYFLSRDIAESDRLRFDVPSDSEAAEHESVASH